MSDEMLPGAAHTLWQGPAPAGSVTLKADGIARAVISLPTAASLLLVANPALPPAVINIRDYGATGDGATDDAPYIQRALTAAGPSQTIYFPSGNYRLGSALSVMNSGITLYGDGDTSRLTHGMGPALHIGGAGAAVSNIKVRSLCFYGAPGKFNADGNGVAHAILVDGARDVTVQEVLFSGPGHAIYQVNQSSGLFVFSCRVAGYGRVAFGLGDGAHVANTTIRQNYPDPSRRGMDYAFYVHNAAKNVLISNCQVSGCGGYGFHYWAQAQVGPGGPVSLLDCGFEDCAIGALVANSPSTAGRIQGLTIRGNRWIGPVRGTCVVIRQGDGVIFENNTIRSGKQPAEMVDCTGLSIGLWGPNDPAGLLTNAIFRNNLIEGWDYPLIARDSNGGTFAGVTVGPNQVTNCRHPVIAEGRAGLTLL
jgi:hypothetical protein